MSYKRILLSLGTIAVVAGVSAGVTGAFFTDTAESQGNTFNSGSLNLQMNMDSIGGGFQGSFDPGQTPGYGDLTPGGDEADLSTQLRNTGSSDAAGIGLAVANNNNSLAQRMRITELAWKDESLLEGGAGASLSEYTPPSSCDVTVDDTESIYADGVDQADSGETVCVEPGTYTGNITVDKKDVTVAALANPASSTPAELDGQFNVTVDGVSIRGFSISNMNGEASTTGGSDERDAVFVGNPDGFSNTSEDVVIEYNLIDGVEDNDNDPKTVEGIHVKKYDSGDPVNGVVIRNNEIKNVQSATAGADGVKLQADVRNVTLANNTITDIDGSWSYGVVATPSSLEMNVPSSVDVELNEMDDITASTYSGVGVGIDGSSDNGFADADEVTLRKNNLLATDYDVLNKNQNQTVDAENNWWGGFTPQDEVQGNVNTSNFAGGPFIGLINGTDNNNNGFADLDDLRRDAITNATPGLNAQETGQFDFTVQLDGPTTNNSFMNQTLNSDFEFTLGQVTQ